MATNQVQMTLAVTADTAKARAQLQDLRKQLDDLSKVGLSNSKGFGFDKELADASKAAAQLKAQLEQATNVKTGKLDLTQFTNSLKQGQMSLQQYQQQLANLGPAGDRAFASLSSAITQAEVPLQRTNGLLKDFGTTLANTAKWQISSNIIHGFQGALQEAFGYAQRLNESLTNIRIVTGQSSEQMAKFAQQANASAQALSTTTTAYTDAALIFYQQGLGDKDVKERTDAVIKMSHATGDAAQQVSSYMTAIWNNFDDGSESLEHYADVIAKLGATTASSSSEISQGLSKFAAIAKTTGLSYEYATASLATLVANTRESADTIGNSLKTIFARLQGLKLGDSLEDGVDLNKYSAALNSVGVKVLDMNGELRDADAILSDMAGKWETLNRAQKVALAQTVAGTRQYATLTSLMDNWDDMEKNLQTAGNADGTLQEQADIYAQSWEAAKDRVTAAAQEIYSQLLNDKFFIGLNDLFTGLLNGISDFIDGLGGVQGVLLTVGTAITTLFRDQIASSIDNVINKFKSLTTTGRQKIEDTRKDANNLLISGLQDSDTTSGLAMANAYKEQGTLQQAYIDNASKMNEVQKSIANSMLDQQQILIRNVELAAQEAEAAEKEATSISRSINDELKKENGYSIISEAEIGEFERANASLGAFKSIMEELRGTISPGTLVEKDIPILKGFISTIEEAKVSGKNFEDVFGEDFEKVFEKLKTSVESGNLTEATANIDKLFGMIDVGSGNCGNKLEELHKRIDIAFDYDPTKAEQLKKFFEDLAKAGEKAGIPLGKLFQDQSKLKTFSGEIASGFQKIQKEGLSASQQLVALGSTLMGITTIARSLSSVLNILSDDTKSFGEKFIAILSTVGSIMLTFATTLKGVTISELATATTTKVLSLAFKEEAVDVAIAKLETAGFLAQLAAAAAPILIVAAAIGALVFAFQKIKENSPEEQLKQAKERAEEASTALDEIKSSAEAVRQEFDNYSNVTEQLSNCVKGTQEWKDALKEVQNETYELLEKYPQLLELGDEYYDKENHIITQDGIKYIENQYTRRERAAKGASIQTNYDQSQLESEQATNNLESALQLLNGNTGVLSNIQKLFYDNGIPIFEESIGVGELTELITENAEKFSGTSIEAQKEILANLLNENGYTNGMGENISSDDLEGLFFLLSSGGLSVQVTNLSDIGTAINQNRQAENEQAKIIGEQSLDSEEINENYRSEIIDMAGTLYQTAYQQAYDSITSENIGDGALKVLLQDLGYNVKEVGQDSVKYEENGEIIEKTKDYMQKLVSSALATGDISPEIKNKLGNEIANLIDINTIADNLVNLDIQNIDGIQDTKKAIFKLISGNIKDLTTAEQQALLENKNIVEDTIKALPNLESLLESSGFQLENFTEYFTQLFNNLKLLENNFSEIAKNENFSRYVNTILGGLDSDKRFGDTTSSEKNMIAQSIQNGYKNNGYTGIDTIVQAFDNFEGETAELYEILGRTYTSEDEFKQALIDHGIAIDDLEVDYGNLIDTMVKAEEKILSLSDAIKASTSAKDASESLEKNGRITQKQYEALEEAGFDNLSSFTAFADGSYGVIGNVELMQQALNDFSTEQFVTMINSTQEELNKKQSLSDNLELLKDTSGTDQNAIQFQKLFLEEYGNPEDENLQNILADATAQGESINQETASDLQSQVAKVIETQFEGSWNEAGETLKADAIQAGEDLKSAAQTMTTGATSFAEAQKANAQLKPESQLTNKQVADAYLASIDKSKITSMDGFKDYVSAKEASYGQYLTGNEKAEIEVAAWAEVGDQIKVNKDNLQDYLNMDSSDLWNKEVSEMIAACESLEDLIALKEKYLESNDEQNAYQVQKNIDSQEKSNIDANFKHNTFYENKKDEYLNSNMSDAAKAENITSALSSSGKSVEDQAKELSSLYSKAFSEGWDSDAIDIFQESIIKLVSSNPDLEIAARLLQLISNSTNELDSTNVDAFGEAFKKVNENAEKDLITLADFSKAINNLDVGETINEDVFNQLMLLAPQLKSSFMDMGDGTYQLLTNAEALRLVMLDVYADARTGDAFTYTNEQLAAQAKTLAELDYLDSKRGLSQEEYLKAEASIGLQYENAKEESLQLLQLLQEQKNLQEQIASLEQEKNLTDEQSLYLEGLKTEEKRKQAELDAAKVSSDVAIGASESAAQFGIDAQAVEDLANYYLELAENGEEAYEHLKDNGKAAVDEARQMIRANEACEDLTKNFSAYSKVLNGLKGSVKDYSKTLANNSKEIKALKKDVAGILDTTEDYIDTNTLAKMSLEDIQKAAEGDIPALRKLQAEQAKSLSSKNGIDEETTNNFNEAMANKGENESVLGGETQTITDADGKQVQMQTLDLDIAPYMQKLAESTAAAGGTAEELQALMSGIGIEMDNAQFFNSLEEAEAWAAESNDRTIQSLAIDAKPTEQTAEQSGEVTNAGFDESYSFFTYKQPIKFQEDEKSKPQSDEVQYVAAHKTVVPKQVTEETTASAPVVAVGYENPHTGSSAGGNVKPSGGGGGGGGGGGRRGGRGRGRAASRATAKSNPDTSHNVKNNVVQQRNNLTKSYENLNKASELAFGKSKLDNMDLEIKKQDEIIKKTRELTRETLKLAKQEKERLMGKTETDLTSQYVTLSARKDGGKWVYDQKLVDKSLAKVNINDIIGNDLKFDAYGNVENEDLINAILENRSNDAQMKLDNASEGKDKADKETEKNRIEAENETIKAELEKYKQDVSDFWEEVADEINQRLEKEAKLLEKRQYQLEINIKVNDNELERLERIMARYEKIDPTIKDIGFSSDSQVANLKNQQNETKNKINNNTAYIEGILEDKGASEKEIKKFLDEGVLSGSWYTRMTPDDMSALNDARSEILSLATAYEELGDQILNLSTSTTQKWNEAIEFQSNKLESGEQTLQHYLNVIDIVGKRQLGLTAQDTFNLRQKQIDAKQITANASKTRYDFAQISENKAKEALDTLKTQLDKAQKSNDEEAIQHAQEQLSIQEGVYRQAVENTQQALQTWEGDVEEALQSAQEAFQAFSEDIQKNLTDPMALLLSENDRDNRKKEGFNDTTTSLHELAKLQKDINDSLDDAANVKNKEALAKILDKINKAKSDSVELSEYETEELRKEYELEVARQKMEEARNAKSEVRMVRDSEGNFSYVYTADDSAMKDAEKEYEDKLQELYELNRDYIDEVKETMLNLPGEMADALADLDEKLLNGIITKEQYDEEAKTIEAFYEDLLKRYQQQLGKALDNQSNLYDDHYKRLAERGHEIAADSKFIDSWEDLADQLNIKDIMNDDIKSLEDFTNYLNNNFNNALTDALNNVSILKKQNEETLGDEGSLDAEGNYVGKAGKNSLTEAAEAINDAAKTAKNEISDLANSGKKDIEDLGTAINNWAQKATEDFKGVANAVTNTAGNIQKLNQELTENSGWDIFKSLNSSNSIVNLADYYKNNYISQDEKGNKTIHTTDLLTSLFRTGITEIPTAISILEEVYKNGANGSLQGIGEDNFAIIKAALGFAGYENIKDEDLKKLIKFDSGGYTGSWDTSGKLAMLHEKELVLNQSDTQNILDAVSIIRDISQAINLNAAASSWMGLGLAQAGKMPNTNTDNALQQYVTITLDAPNLTDKNSILEAFDNVINLASQYAYR